MNMHVHIKFGYIKFLIITFEIIYATFHKKLRAIYRFLNEEDT